MITVKKTAASDFPRLAIIYRDGFNEPPYNEGWTSGQTLDKLKLFSKYCEVFSILYDKELAGFLVLNPNLWKPGEVMFGEEMAVDKNFRGRGIGTFMMNWMVDYAKSRGFKRVMFFSNNKSGAYKLYNKLGFSKSDEVEVFSKELNQKNRVLK
ncbi:GNAT family N-acetyltransferase [Candidatus Pacearchaeota archaeon]|nr:GNAT family N-acetyltransferase [Candidatus Pacearchaeota archaeon]